MKKRTMKKRGGDVEVQIEDWYFARKQADGAMTMTWTAPQLQALSASARLKLN